MNHCTPCLVALGLILFGACVGLLMFAVALYHVIHDDPTDYPDDDLGS